MRKIDFLIIFLFLCFNVHSDIIQENFTSIENLDSSAVFSFSIMSDNKGESPSSSNSFSNMVNWIEKSGDKFVIGLGDHIKKTFENSFFEFLEQNDWWLNNFYPNIADGENEYYGNGQGDWGAGGSFLDLFSLKEKAFVTIRENNCEYYANIPFDSYNIHLIQLHFSDTPRDPTIAFCEDSREYLINTLKSINKEENDIIIVAAHSINGSWIEELQQDNKNFVMNKADLVLSATTHFFKRIIVEEWSDSGALCINTGSVSYPSSYCPGGYVQVHILKDPLRLSIQYINSTIQKRELQNNYYAFIKVINGKIYSPNYREIREEEDFNRIVAFSNHSYSNEELIEVFTKEVIQLLNTDNAYFELQNGLSQGDISYKDLWNIIPYNNQIYILSLSEQQLFQIFENSIDSNGKDSINLAINSYIGNYIINELELSDNNIIETDFYEHDILTKIIK